MPTPSGSKIPEFIGSLSRLQYLNLSHSNFKGSIPHQIGNLSQLQFLDLSCRFTDYIESGSLDWLSNLPSLIYLDLSWLYLCKATDWLQVVRNLPLLRELILSYCFLPNIFAPTFSLANSSATLAILDLSHNILLLFNFSSSLTHVKLQSSNLQGNIPDAFGNMTSLVYLGLSDNHLQGGIPKSFGNLSNLESLDIIDVGLSGQLPELIENLSGRTITKLRYLNLAGNKISVLFPDISRFSALAELKLQDSESGIQVKDASCAVTVVQREPEIPHSPSTTGKESNQVMAVSFYDSLMTKNSLPRTMQQMDGGRGGYANHWNFPSLADDPEDCHGESKPPNLLHSHVQDEAGSSIKKNKGQWCDARGHFEDNKALQGVLSSFGHWATPWIRCWKCS